MLVKLLRDERQGQRDQLVVSMLAQLLVRPWCLLEMSSKLSIPLPAEAPIILTITLLHYDDDQLQAAGEIVGMEEVWILNNG